MSSVPSGLTRVSPSSASPCAAARVAAPPTRTANVEGLQPEQVVNALDEMEVLDQFNHLMKPESSTSKM